MKAQRGVRVLIAREPCPLHARRIYGAKPTRVAYVADTCDQCGECLDTLACPAFHKMSGKVEINPLLCAGCMLCLQVCSHIKARKLEAK